MLCEPIHCDLFIKLQLNKHWFNEVFEPSHCLGFILFYFVSEEGSEFNNKGS